MNKFEFSVCKSKSGTVMEGVLLAKPTVYGDSRGYFMEAFNAEFMPFIKHIDGSSANFVQENESYSRRGVLRGLHFQKTQPQGKLVRVVQGEVYDVAVDLRRNSPTYGEYCGVILSSENKLQFYVPEGFAHGFLVLSETATFIYKCTRFYFVADECGILWNSCGIEWPAIGCPPILNEKDTVNAPLNRMLDGYSQ